MDIAREKRKQEILSIARAHHDEEDIEQAYKETEYIGSPWYQNMSAEERLAFHTAQFALMGSRRADRDYMKDKLHESSYNDLQKGYMSDLID